MMAPITADGDNLLWDYLGRRFVPLSYDEADRFCQYSREFITSLLPKEPIYLSLLPPAARAVVGEVNGETRSARRMLERLGFEYEGHVDPFDGGPHLRAKTDEIPPVAMTRRLRVADPVAMSKCKDNCIVSVLDPDGEFRAINEYVRLVGENKIAMPRECLRVLQIEPGETVGVTPFVKVKASSSGRKKAAKKSKATSRKKKAGAKK